ncbi:hypothetical protein Aperf_G00000020648 [Anoplocephala perfoliata]
MFADVSQVKPFLDAYGQSHLYKYWNELSDGDKRRYFNELVSLNLDRINSAYENALKTSENTQVIDERLMCPDPSICAHAAAIRTSRPQEAISETKVAAVLLAGGQGTRLGSANPKGLYDIGLPSKRSLFQIQAERLLSLCRLVSAKFGQQIYIPWYIMSSDYTQKLTEEYFRQNNYFGYKQDHIIFFEQFDIPVLNLKGQILMKDKSSLCWSPEGNGGLYRALLDRGILHNMKSRGIQYVHIYGVDNVLIQMADPAFIGFCISRTADCAVKVVEKTDPKEPIGVVGVVDNKYRVVEYSEMSSSTAALKLPTPPCQAGVGSRLLYSLGNICNHFMTTAFLEQVCDRSHETQLPYHLAYKKVPHLDMDTGELVVPSQPNALKLEKFIFDVLQFSQRFYIWEVDRAAEFSPLKNGPGAQKDCPETCRKAILGMHASWAKAAGAIFEDEKRDILEISPLVSTNGENLESLKDVKIVGVNILELQRQENGEALQRSLRCQDVEMDVERAGVAQDPYECNENLDLKSLKQRVKDMFYHGYDNYMKFAYPYDELRPLTCDGYDTWGSFSLTLIDSLDTLVVLGNYSEFRKGVKLVLENIDTNINVNVSVFETNIRIVGGLLSAHLLAKRAGMVVEPGWPCHGKLLDLAERFANKLLNAFGTPTGMPYGTINLAKGQVPPRETPISCVATIGTLILEFGALSRLTGDFRYEEAALKALRSLWTHRSSLGLVGNHINVLTGSWVGKEATIGAGVDSYFEYLFKGSILFRLPELDAMFREYRDAIRKHLKFGAWHFMATMDSSSVTSAVYQSLESFWPGVLAMAGEIEEAKELLISYHSLWKKYGFLPEMFDVPSNKPLKSHSVYPLRPEFIESIMHVYRATKDPYLLEMGVNVLTSIERDARTSCGFAGIRDVQTHTKENRMESFFLSETTKYLYLLFDEDNFLHKTLPSSSSLSFENLDGICTQGTGYVFNSEAHPLDAGLIHCCSIQRLRESEVIDSEESLSTDLGLHTDLGSLVNASAVTGSFEDTILSELDATFEEICSPSIATVEGKSSSDREIDGLLENLWKDMSKTVLLSSGPKETSPTPPWYEPPKMLRKSMPPLMSCPTVPFHVRLSSMRDMDYRNLK